MVAREIIVSIFVSFFYTHTLSLSLPLSRTKVDTFVFSESNSRTRTHTHTYVCLAARWLNVVIPNSSATYFVVAYSMFDKPHYYTSTTVSIT